VTGPLFLELVFRAISVKTTEGPVLPVVKTPFKSVERPGKPRLRQLLGPFFPKKATMERFFAVLPPQAPPEGTVPASGRVMKVSAVQGVAGPENKAKAKKRERAVAVAEVIVPEPLERRRSCGCGGVACG
jgi:hypothetical protein